jgi:hypothetical protein
MRLLLDVLARPASCARLDASQLDVLVRTARAARLLGVVAARIDRAGATASLPPRVVDHLRAATAEAAHCRQMVQRQLASVADTLRPLNVRLIALKGASYILRHQACADGRLPRDVDILTDRDRLDEVERCLVDAGWSATKTDPHDQKYYRAWSHELPPLRSATMPFELDVHHTILPPLGRLRPDPRLLVDAAVPDGRTGWWTLDAADQVLHAAAHLFQDSDCVGRLRDLVDIDALMREAHAGEPAFAARLAERAAALGLQRPLWYAAELAHDWLDLPDAIALPLLRGRAPAWPASAWVPALARRCLAVTDPDGEPGVADRLAFGAMAARAQWLRMPPWLVVYHAAHKLVRTRPRPAEDPAV